MEREEVILVKASLVKIGLGVMTLLASANIYFIKGLVDEVKSTSAAVSGYQEKLNYITKELSQIEPMSRDVADLKARVAVLEFALAHGVKVKAKLLSE